MLRPARARWLVPVVSLFLGACADEPPTAPDRVAPEAGDVAVTAALDSLHSISAGATHACGLDVSGAAFCWGSNYHLQLGHTASENCYGGGGCSPRPVRVAGGRHYTSVSAGGTHSCGVEAGTGFVFCWGDNSAGQFGDGGVEDSRFPRRAAAPGISFSSVSAGFTHTCALAVNGRIWCWGYNGEGAVSGPGLSVLTPRRVEGTRDYVMVSAGAHHTCAIGVNTLAYCWGANNEGQIGDTIDGDTATTVRRVVGPNGYTWITAGANHTCGIRGSAGQAWCWGANYFEALGRTGTGGPVPTPVSGRREFDQLSAGGYHTCGRQTNGRVTCWGYGGLGQVGIGGNAPINPPTRIPGHRSYATLDVGEWFSCATDGLGDAYCWGDNSYGQVGRPSAGMPTCGGIPCATSPLRVGGGVEFAAVAAER